MTLVQVWHRQQHKTSEAINNSISEYTYKTHHTQSSFALV